MGKIKPIYSGQNHKGQFVVDEDTGNGVYTEQEKFNQVMYKINELVEVINKHKRKR